MLRKWSLTLMALVINTSDRCYPLALDVFVTYLTSCGSLFAGHSPSTQLPLAEQWLVQGVLHFVLEGVDDGNEHPADTVVVDLPRLAALGDAPAADIIPSVPLPQVRHVVGQRQGGKGRGPERS